VGEPRGAAVPHLEHALGSLLAGQRERIAGQDLTALEDDGAGGAPQIRGRREIVEEGGVEGCGRQRECQENGNGQGQPGERHRGHLSWD
jgi:hypothetical protein